MQNKRILVIGLGLIGGSLVKALAKRASCKNISAIDTNTKSLEHALDEGLIQRGITKLDDDALNSDLIFLCTPVHITLSYIDKLLGNISPSCIVSDTCSTKGEITDYVLNLNKPLRFIGGHPMAGSETNGFINSKAHLFENACYVLTPTQYSSANDVLLMKQIISLIGAIPIIMDANEHDRVTAGISHLPHIAAAALVNLIKHSDNNGNMQLLAAGGFKDITRIASSNAQLWGNIISSNSRQVVDALNRYITNLEAFKEMIKSQGTHEMIDYFSEAQKYRDELNTDVRGLIEPSYEIAVDVVDKPGIIGRLATLLGENGINIKNISVSNSREFENGCLRITLPDRISLKNAINILTVEGYRFQQISS